jgi:CheY-like chemotaxis protein
MGLTQDDRILVVDDNLPMRMALAETLRFLNYHTLEAGNGQEALEIIDQYLDESSGPGQPRLVLIMSDLSMPVIDGKELFYILHQRGIKLPFIMLSGYIDKNELDDMQAMGLAGWLHKPADIEQISSLLENIFK